MKGQGLGFMVHDSGFRVEGLGFRVQGSSLGFRRNGFGIEYDFGFGSWAYFGLEFS